MVASSSARRAGVETVACSRAFLTVETRRASEALRPGTQIQNWVNCGHVPGTLCQISGHQNLWFWKSHQHCVLLRRRKSNLIFGSARYCWSAWVHPWSLGIPLLQIYFLQLRFLSLTVCSSGFECSRFVVFAILCLGCTDCSTVFFFSRLKTSSTGTVTSRFFWLGTECEQISEFCHDEAGARETPPYFCETFRTGV